MIELVEFSGNIRKSMKEDYLQTTFLTVFLIGEH